MAHPPPARSAGFARLRPVRRGLVRSARALAAVALLALSAALALPATAQAQADPPTLSSASVTGTGDTVSLVFSQSIDLQSEFLPTSVVNAFTVTVDGVELQIDSVAGSLARQLNILLLSEIYQGQTVVISYDRTVAGSDAIADSDGDEVASFTTQRRRRPSGGQQLHTDGAAFRAHRFPRRGRRRRGDAVPGTRRGRVRTSRTTTTGSGRTGAIGAGRRSRTAVRARPTRPASR